MGGHDHPRNAEAEPKKDQDLAVLKAAKIPLAYRDKCGHLLVDLNKCRREKMFSPNECSHERHTYEECEYYAWKDRVNLKKKEQQA
jgi:NADH dehydrogenase (ubiquinone) 1 beta subcomplex subunit 7